MKRTLNSLIILSAISIALPVPHASADVGSVAAGIGDALNRDRPGPRPGPGPGPAPTNNPVPPPGPAPVDVTRARADGREDGWSGGTLEGRERGQEEGQKEGREDGFRAGHDRCYQEQSRAAYDRGFSDGFSRGSDDGSSEGRARGSSDGNSRGIYEGQQDGQRRADQDAERDASPRGTADGINQANGSDATARGTADGSKAGDKQASDHANEVDYPRGREAYRQERFNEAIANNDEFSQLGLATKTTSNNLKKAMSVIETAREMVNETRIDTQRRGGGGRGPDNRYFRPSRTYGTPEENAAYQDSYRGAYNEGFRAEFDRAFDNAYDRAFRNQEDRGCDDARRENYRPHYDNGFRAGRDKGYQQAYQPTYDSAFRDAYSAVFGPTSAQAYRDAYQPAYDRHYEESRAAAYSQRVGELYNAAFEDARVRKYNQTYPGYADAANKRGRKDEAQDFANRPVRLLGAEVQETIENGVLEPGETLRVKLDLRNFAEGAVQGRDIKVKIEAMDDSSTVIVQSETILAKNLREKSRTRVRDALDFRMNESAANRVSRFVVTAFYQGRKIGEQTLDVNTKFLLDVQLAEPLTLKDGLATVVKLRVTNQSQKPSDPVVKVKFVSDPKKLDIANPEQGIGALAPGESKVLEYTVTAHTTDAWLRIPVAFTATGSAGRRIGLLDMTQQVPVVNDYRVALTNAIGGLQKAGVIRANYKVTNTGSRLLYKSLQLKVTFKDTDNGDNFVVIGPNPQYLMPMEQGETAQFVVPVLVKADNRGGTLVLELMEDGRTVVIREENFK